MAITTKATLLAAAADALVRSDLTSQIATSLPLAEAWLNRNLRLRLMETNASLVGVVSSRLVALPTDFLEPITLLRIESAGACELEMIPPGHVAQTAAGCPQTWAVEGANIGFERPCNTAYAFTLRYLARFTLTDDDDTNDLLAAWPDLYLMALLVAVCGVYLTDDPRLGVWVQARDGLLAEVNRKEARSKAPTQLRSDSSFRQWSRSRDTGFICA